jgi:hypothetical protein
MSTLINLITSRASGALLPTRLADNLPDFAGHDDEHLLHLHQSESQEPQSHLFAGAGVLTAVVFLELAITGVLLMFYYVPSAQQAFGDINRLQANVPLGQLLRNLHRWGAHLMDHRRSTWSACFTPARTTAAQSTGWCVVLLVLTLGAATGYLLPWDQLSTGHHCRHQHCVLRAAATRPSRCCWAALRWARKR